MDRNHMDRNRMDRNHRDELDRIVDRGLTGYSNCEPLAGLEDRILNRVRLGDAGRRHSRLWPWALVVPALATLATVAVLSRSGRAPSAKPIQTTRVLRIPLANARGSDQSRDRKRAIVKRKTGHHTRPRVLPKRDQFPTPTPLTPEERALVVLARLRPDEVEAFVELQKKNSDEITIPPI